MLLKTINEQTRLAATWVRKAETERAEPGGEAELARKHEDSRRAAVKAVRGRADEVEAILWPKN